MGKLKVLIITSKFPRFERDAQPPFTYDLARELIKNDCEVYVIAPHDSYSKTKEFFHGMHVYRFKYFFPARLEKVAYGPGIPDNLKKSMLARIQAIPFTISQILMTRAIVKKINPDIIHAHWAFPQGLAALYSGKPYICTIYGGEVFMAKKYHLISLLDKIIKNSKKSFSITKGLREVARGFGIKSSLGVIPLGVDTEKFYPDIQFSDKIKSKYCKKNELMILSVGRLVDKKGHKYLLEAFSKVTQKIPNCKLVIVGDGPLYSDLLNQTKRLKIESKVFFTKEIDHKELPKYYCAADLFVLPSIIDSIGNRETQGVVFLEAMASKCPVIGTNTGGIPDVISNEGVGVLVPQKNSEILAKKIVLILLDKGLRNKLVANAYDHIQNNFRWDSIAKLYISVYNNSK